MTNSCEVSCGFVVSNEGDRSNRLSRTYVHSFSKTCINETVRNLQKSQVLREANILMQENDGLTVGQDVSKKTIAALPFI